MTKRKIAGSPKSKVDFSSLCLTALHVAVLGIALWVHPIYKPAERALPYVVAAMFPIAEAAAPLKHIRANAHFGKIVLTA